MSSRNSRRGRGQNRGVILIGGAVVLVGLVVGTVFIFKPSGANTKPADNAVADALPEAGNPSAPAAENKPSVNLSQLAKVAAEARATIALPQGDAREKSLRETYGALAALLEGPLPTDEREKLIEPFHAVTTELFLSPTHNEFSVNYVVKGGDKIDSIARSAGISNNLLTDLNAMPRGFNKLRIGDNMKLPKGKPHIEVRKQDYCCSVYLGDYLVRQYVVAHGKNNNTPEGRTTIKDMQVNPDAEARGPGDPRAEMKLRWIGLTPYNDRTGIGFHGTKEPNSIPGQTSRGCIRMKDNDVVELYDFVRIGNAIEIKA
ncbi:MAG: L,D-transpeptidase family protein [Planctomycetes bacterium]|nr:L,D-transpeptidase family protein [Planctomycetota bacterium]